MYMIKISVFSRSFCISIVWSSLVSNAAKLDMHVAQTIFCLFIYLFFVQYIRTCMQAKEPPHVTLVHNNTVKAMFDREITAIGAALAPKSCNLPLPLPPKKRAPTVSWMSVSFLRLLLARRGDLMIRDSCAWFLMYSVLAGPWWWLPWHPPGYFCLNSLAKMRLFPGIHLLRAKQVWRFTEQTCIWQLPPVFFFFFFYHSEHPAFKCRDEFNRPSLPKTPEIWFQCWLCRCLWTLQHMALFLSASRAWKHWFHNFCSIPPHVIITLWRCFTVKTEIILPHFHISGRAHARVTILDFIVNVGLFSKNGF